MKNVLALLAVAGIASAASATTYTDSQNDLFDNGFGHLDITSVDVTHDATYITFVINVRTSLDAPNDWGKYCIGIDMPGNATNDTTNGWGRNVSWGGQGIDFYVGSWVDGGGGAELRAMSGNDDNSNVLLDATYTTNTLVQHSISSFARTIRIDRAAIGIPANGSFNFDVFTTANGGGDPGVDHLSRSDLATTDWSVQSVAGTFLTYTIPTPGALALVGMGGLVAARRRRA